jgi:hypothetical protein
MTHARIEARRVRMGTTLRQRAAWSALILVAGFSGFYVYGLLFLPVLDAVLP